MKSIYALAVAAGLVWGDVMPVGRQTIVELPRDVWVSIRTSGGHVLEGILVDSDERRVVVEGEQRHFIDADAVEAVSVAPR